MKKGTDPVPGTSTWYLYQVLDPSPFSVPIFRRAGNRNGAAGCALLAQRQRSDLLPDRDSGLDAVRAGY
jgi:hypothetical protein